MPTKRQSKAESSDFNKPVELVSVDELKPHPRNYQNHPDDQLEHLMTSIKENGFYRNVVIASDNVILAGHGAVEAARKLGMVNIPVIRLAISSDDKRALKVLTGDNEISHLAERDDRLLSELLKEVNDELDLLGTGFDEMMLANLVMVTRPASEIADFDEAAHWVGMPEYENPDEVIKSVVSFRNEDDRNKFMQLIGVSKPLGKTRNTTSFWWPEKDKEDLTSLKFKG